MRDFTIPTYKKVLNTLQQQGFSFLSVHEFISESVSKAIILRHDVDALPGNSLKFARIQANQGTRGTYYFRIVPESFDVKIIKQISDLGHEIGYHYEDVSMTAGRLRDLETKRLRDKENIEEEVVKIAIESFKENLDRLRQIVPVNTICMHGSPMSRWDSRLLWKYYDYHDFGIISEPYFDINFAEVLYLTDTGRRWDGDSVNIRDKATKILDEETKRRRDEETRNEEKISLNPSVSQSLSPLVNSTPGSPPPAPCLKLHSTFDIIKAAVEGNLPDKIMMTFHPQRWTDKPLQWVKELVWQNVKNTGKYFLIRLRNEV